jgi:tetratricopeptide (TPR) repeat protein
VRPPEPAFPWRPRKPSDELLAALPQLAAEQLRAAQDIPIEPEAYVAALRDWAEHGAASRFALSEDEVVARSRPRDPDRSRAAACFELAAHLHRGGEHDDAVPWFREAHRLAPENWTYKRQAWSFADPLQGPSELYESDWLSEFRRAGAEAYYEAVELEPPSARS